MKKFFKTLVIVICIIFIGILGYLLGMKIKDDALAQKNSEMEKQNIQAESEFLSDRATSRIQNLMSNIQNELGVNIEVADIGSIEENDIYFVTKVNENYMYITKVTSNGEERFEIASDNSQDAKYIISLKSIGMDECVYTKLKDYSIDKDGKVTYTGKI